MLKMVVIIIKNQKNRVFSILWILATCVLYTNRTLMMMLFRLSPRALLACKKIDNGFISVIFFFSDHSYVTVFPTYSYK